MSNDRELANRIAKVIFPFKRFISSLEAMGASDGESLSEYSAMYGSENWPTVGDLRELVQATCKEGRAP